MCECALRCISEDFNVKEYKLTTRLFLLTRTSMLRYLFMFGDTDCSHARWCGKTAQSSKECKNSHNSIKVFVVAQVWVRAQFTFSCVYNEQSKRVLCACRCYDTASANGSIDCYEKYFNALTQQSMKSLAIPMFARMPMQCVCYAFFHSSRFALIRIANKCETFLWRIILFLWKNVFIFIWKSKLICRMGIGWFL